MGSKTAFMADETKLEQFGPSYRPVVRGLPVAQTRKPVIGIILSSRFKWIAFPSEALEVGPKDTFDLDDGVRVLKRLAIRKSESSNTTPVINPRMVR